MLIPYHLYHSDVSDIFGCVLDLVSLDFFFLTFFVSNAGEEKDQCLFKTLFSFLIAYMCFYTRLPHHFITCINVDLTSVVVTFPSLSGLNTLFPCHCTFFVLFKQTADIFLSLASSFSFQGHISRITLLYSFTNCLQLHMYARSS